jgi:hypothetical protein
VQTLQLEHTRKVQRLNANTAIGPTALPIEHHEGAGWDARYSSSIGEEADIWDNEHSEHF